MSAHPVSPPYWLGALLVGAGASLGALSRYGLTHAIGVEPWATTVINIIGCALFGAIAIAAAQQPRLALFLGTGFCGGFTTFSAFSLLTVTAARADAISLAAGIILAHILLCPLAYFLGSIGASMWTERQRNSGSRAVSAENAADAENGIAR